MTYKLGYNKTVEVLSTQVKLVEMNEKFWSENWKTHIVMSKGRKNYKLRL